jgi:hypothetical protein
VSGGHGDWITVTGHGSVIVHGRSDSTLNRNGVRTGSADIYYIVEKLPEIRESLVLGIEYPHGGYWMPLFVVLADGARTRRRAPSAHLDGDSRRSLPQARPRRRHRGGWDTAHQDRQEARASAEAPDAGSRLSSVVDAQLVEDAALLDVFSSIAHEQVIRGDSNDKVIILDCDTGRRYQARDLHEPAASAAREAKPFSRQRRRAAAESGHIRLLQGIKSDYHRSDGHEHSSTSRYFSWQREPSRLVSHLILKLADRSLFEKIR